MALIRSFRNACFGLLTIDQERSTPIQPSVPPVVNPRSLLEPRSYAGGPYPRVPVRSTVPGTRGSHQVCSAALSKLAQFDEASAFASKSPEKLEEIRGDFTLGPISK